MDVSLINLIGGASQGPPDPIGEPRGGPPKEGEFSLELASQLGDTEAIKTQDRTEPKVALKDGRLKKETAVLESPLALLQKSAAGAKDTIVEVPPTLSPVGLAPRSVDARGAPGLKTDKAAKKPEILDSRAAENQMSAALLASTLVPNARVSRAEPKAEAAILKRPIENIGSNSTGQLELLKSLKSSLDDLESVKQDMKQMLDGKKGRELKPFTSVPGFAQAADVQPMVIAIPIVLQVPPTEVHVFPVDMEVLESKDSGLQNMMDSDSRGSHVLMSTIGGGSTEDLLNVMTGLSHMKNAANVWGHNKQRGHDKESGQDEKATDVSSLLQGLLSRGAQGSPRDVGFDTKAIPLSSGVTTALGKDVPVAPGRVDVSNALQMAQVVQGLTNQGVGSIRIKLHPEVLGEMVVSLAQTRGATGKRDLTVHFDASTAEARAALTQTMGELRHALKARDNKLGTLDIQVNGDQLASASWLGSIDGYSSLSSKNINNSNGQDQNGFDRNQGQSPGQNQQGQFGSLNDDRGRGHVESLWERFYGEGGQGFQGDSSAEKRYNPRRHYAGAEL